MNRNLKAVGVVLTVVTLGYTTVNLVGLTARDVSTRTVSHRDVKAIVVSSDAGTFELTGTDSASEITGTRRVTQGLRSPEITETVDADGTLRIKVECPVFFNIHCSADYALNVPKGISVSGHADGNVRLAELDGELDLKSSGGSLTAVKVTGTVRLKSSAGGVTVSKATGPLDLSSSAGGIKVTDSTSASVLASSSAGGVRIEMAADASIITASSSAGGVTVIVPRSDATYVVRASTSAGSTSTQVKTDPDSKRVITAESSAGDVKVVYPADTNN